jgi:hypothetical protein
MAIARQTALREVAARSTFVQRRGRARKNSSKLNDSKITDFGSLRGLREELEDKLPAAI